MSPRHRPKIKSRALPRRALLLLVIGLGLWATDAYRARAPGKASETPASDSSPKAASISAGDAEIQEAFRKRRSGFFVEVEGVIEKLLRDDNEGSRHQRFILRLDSGHTVLISHNIDLAPRIPARERDRVGVRGKYEWNEQGGVLHWTHHDPQGRKAGGWIRAAGETFR